MCRTLRIVTCYEKEMIESLIKQFHLNAYIDCDSEGNIVKTNDGEHVVMIEGTKDSCFCNVDVEIKEKLFNFIHAISI